MERGLNEIPTILSATSQLETRATGPRCKTLSACPVVLCILPSFPVSLFPPSPQTHRDTIFAASPALVLFLFALDASRGSPFAFCFYFSLFRPTIMSVDLRLLVSDRCILPCGANARQERLFPTFAVNAVSCSPALLQHPSFFPLLVSRPPRPILTGDPRPGFGTGRPLWSSEMTYLYLLLVLGRSNGRRLQSCVRQKQKRGCKTGRRVRVVGAARKPP